jgi:hypothetical protein
MHEIGDAVLIERPLDRIDAAPENGLGRDTGRPFG